MCTTTCLLDTQIGYMLNYNHDQYIIAVWGADSTLERLAPAP